MYKIIIKFFIISKIFIVCFFNHCTGLNGEIMAIHSINVINNISFTSKKRTKTSQKETNRSVTPAIKVLPVAIVMIPVGTVVTSCVQDNRKVFEVGWLDVAANRLSDEDIERINETRQAPKNTVFQKINETTTETYTDSQGNTQTRIVETGGWHYELVNNLTGTETGTTVLPEGYTVQKDILGFIEIVEDGSKGIFLKKNNKNEAEINKKDTIKNDVGFLQTATGLLTDKQIENMNKSGVVPEGTIIVKTSDGGYELENDRLGLKKGTRQIPSGYEIRKDLFGFMKIVPVDQKSIFLRNKTKTISDTVKNNKDINFLQAETSLLTDEQIKEINKTKKMPEGTVIAKDELGNYYITSDIFILQSGTRTLPKGYEVKKDKLGFAIVVPIGTKGILID